MYGAILGDMIGAPYEFDRGNKTKEFPLFIDESHFTDDTVMTIAVAEALLDHPGASDEEIRKAVVESMQKWGRKYPGAGYGRRFVGWLHMKDPEPYGSYGNGSAMRVSSAGWLCGSLEETRRIARLTSEVTHNHPEGIKGAEATAAAIYLARIGTEKEEIREYIASEFGYDFSRTCDEIRPGYHHVESCQETVPEAITAFLEGTDFEDVIRTAVSLGGDCDTLTCIAGSIAEAFYGVPLALVQECRERLPEDMIGVLDRFDAVRNSEDLYMPEGYLSGNTVIEDAIDRFHQENNHDAFVDVIVKILVRMNEHGYFVLPIILTQKALDMMDPDHTGAGDIVIEDEEPLFEHSHYQTEDGKIWNVAFTSKEECRKGDDTSSIACPIEESVRSFSEMPEEGIVINPWGQSFYLTKEWLSVILDAYKHKPENRIDLVQDDITTLDVDAIVNAAKPSLLGGGGVDGAIHEAAGPELLEECRTLNGCRTGEAKITKGYRLKAKYVIHTVGPVYSGKKEDAELLAACYHNSLELAKQHDLHTIAFPAISTGIYGYPLEEAAPISLTAIYNWMDENEFYGMAVTLCARSRKTLDAYQRAMDQVAFHEEGGKDS